MTPEDLDESRRCRGPRPYGESAAIALILTFAAALRFFKIGRLSYGYDEVVSVTVARGVSPRAFPRAPLYPFVLRSWTWFFGSSEAASRSLSAVCGVLTVAMIYRIARRASSDGRTPLWAAGLAAISPMLLAYSREVRVDSWLVLVTCLAWDALFSLGFRPTGQARASTWALAWYALALAALVYSHPLGLVMVVALALASGVNARTYGLDVKRWLAAHLTAALLIAPGLKAGLDLTPDTGDSRWSLPFLFRMPIGFPGGNLLSFAGLLGLVALGFVTIRAREERRGWRVLCLERPAASVALVIWLIVPLLLLSGYSRFAHPIPDPARSTLFVGPAFLILLARGIARLPCWLGGLAGAGIALLGLLVLPELVYAPELRADWRAMAARLDHRDPAGIEPVMVVSNDPARNLEIIPARYYLGAKRPALALPCPVSDVVALRRANPPRLWVAVGTHHGLLTADLPPSLRLRRDAEVLDVPGLRLIAINPLDLP